MATTLSLCRLSSQGLTFNIRQEINIGKIIFDLNWKLHTMCDIFVDFFQNFIDSVLCNISLV